MRIRVDEINSQDVFIDRYELKKSKDDFGQIIEIESTAKFEGEDFRALINKSKNGENRSEAELTIYCGEDEIVKSGHILHNEGKYNLVSCVAEKKVYFDHPLECIKDRTFNIFDYEPTITKTIQGTVEKDFILNEPVFVNFFTDDFALDEVITLGGGLLDRSAEGWYYEQFTISCAPIFQTNQFNEIIYLGHEIIIAVYYYRITNPISLGDDWAPLPDGSGFFQIEITPQNWIGPTITIIPQNGINAGQYIQKVWAYGRTNLFTNREISNTFLLNQIIEDLLSCIGFPVVSNFFNINPDGTAPTNSQYQYASLNYQNLRIAQSFDIIRESAITDSFGISGQVKFKDFIESVTNMFNVTIVVDDVAGVTRLEHITYFERKGIDFEANNIQYELNPEFEMNKELINVETLKIGIEVENPEFFQAQIDYRNTPFNTDPNEVFIEAKLFLTDLFGLINNEKYNQSNYQKLFFILQTDGNSVIRQNKGLSAIELLENIHNVNRPYSVGFINDNFVRFKGFSFGLEGQLKFYSSIKTFDKLLIGNTIKVRQGTFLIDEITINEKSLITLKILK